MALFDCTYNDDEETDTHQGKILRGFLVGPRKYMDGVVDGQRTRCLLGFYFWGSPDREYSFYEADKLRDGPTDYYPASSLSVNEAL